MKKFVLSIVALGGLSTAALAADLPARGPAPAPFTPLPIFTWTGFYVGVNAGYVFSDDTRSPYIGNPGYVGLAGLGAVPAGYRIDAEGFIGGVQAGYNVQFGSLVAGVEADIQYTDIGKTAFASGTLATGSSRLNMDYLGTVRARLGFVAMERMLLYVTGGLAYGEVELRGTITGIGPIAGATWGGSSSSVETGWTLGGGLEYAFTDNLTLKAEYLYYDLGNVQVTKPALTAVAAATGVFGVQRAEANGHIARVGVNYKF